MTAGIIPEFDLLAPPAGWKLGSQVGRIHYQDPAINRQRCIKFA